jgi:uncharacterized secreted repeat protein (TIGR03808 family)
VADVTEIGDNGRMSTLRPTRRTLIAGLATALAAPALIGRAIAEDVNPLDFGVQLLADGDQSAALQAAIDAAADSGRDVRLPPGEFTAANLRLPGAVRLIGTSRDTTLVNSDGQPVITIVNGRGTVIDGVSFHSTTTDAIIILEDGVEAALIANCMFSGDGIGIRSSVASATIDTCTFIELRDAAVHSVNSADGLIIRGNRVVRCGNAGFRIWRDEPGHDGSIVTGNSISDIDWVAGGNGQNGNGVNIFQADDVIVSDNVISDCAFTAVRVNAGRNTQVRGNTCLRSGEVAIFSEFGFSGSIIADNIIDGAATGIDITNLDSGGYLATCTGNIVRNITPSSAVNPDTRPVGIYAEADTVVANNVIENVPGIGIAAGYGPFVRNVSVTGNVMTGCTMGIGVTVVDDPQVGHVTVSGNMISGATAGGIVGMEWENVVSDDLARDAGKYAHVLIADNAVA